MNKERYINLLEKEFNSNISRPRMDSILSLVSCDKDLTKNDREEIMLYLVNICTDNIRSYRDSLLNDPLTSSSKIDDYNSQINVLIKSFEKPVTKTDYFKNN
jgi:hypothetical protein